MNPIQQNTTKEEIINNPTVELGQKESIIAMLTAAIEEIKKSEDPETTIKSLCEALEKTYSKEIENTEYKDLKSQLTA